MQSFETIAESQLAQMLRQPQELKLLISEVVVRFKTHIPQVSFADPTEVPPTSAIFTPEGLAQVIAHGGNDLNGKYIRFVVTVYAYGGKILYRSASPSEYEAHVVWPSA
jgi:hypothetical protein